MLGHICLEVDGPDLYNLILECVELSLEVRLLSFHDPELDQLLSDLSHLVRDVADVAELYKWLRIEGLTEDFLENLDLPKKFLLFLDLLLGALSSSNDFRELGSDCLIIILDVLLHLKPESLDGTLEFLLLFLLVSILPCIDQLKKTVATGYLGLIVMNNLPDLSL